MRSICSLSVATLLAVLLCGCKTWDGMGDHFPIAAVADHLPPSRDGLNPFVEPEGGMACPEVMEQLRSLQPYVVTEKLRTISPFCDSDVICALVCSVSGEPCFDLSYRGKRLSWHERQYAPAEEFFDVLEEQPSVLACLIYAYRELDLAIYYFKTENELRVFLLDTMNGESPARMLPDGARLLPIGRLIVREEIEEDRDRTGSGRDKEPDRVEPDRVRP